MQKLCAGHRAKDQGSTREVFWWGRETLVKFCVCVHKLTNRGKSSCFQKEKNKGYMSLDMVWKIMEGSMWDAEGETRGF